MPPADQITGAFPPGVDFASSALAGLAIGLFLDWWWGTAPVLVVIGIVAGFASGFYKLWRYSEIIETQAEGRSHGR
jgi:F0F1-type ATP synthase assembly protein I